MNICIGYKTADVILELNALKKNDLESSDISSLESFGANKPDVLGLLGESLLSTEIPELVVGRATHHRKHSACVTHIWSKALAPGALLHFGEGLYLSSPEFCIVQQAQQLSFAGLCTMIMRYCGSYTINPRTQQFENRPPLSSFERIYRFLNQIRGAKGTQTVRKALRYCVEASNSPTETQLALLLTLPRAMGGFQLPKPHMNYEVDFQGVSRTIARKSRAYVDLYWPDKYFGLEYSGEEEHAGKLGEDLARSYALISEGSEVWFITKHQLGDAAQMNVIVKGLIKRLKLRIRVNTWPSQRQTQALINELRKVS